MSQNSMNAAAAPVAMRLYYPVIDIIRFGAAVSVVLFHLAFLAWVDPANTAEGVAGIRARIPAGIAMWWGGVGVPVFFVISGFVIAASANGASAFSFARSRIERLYPAVWICATVTLLVLLANRHMPAGEIARLYGKSVLLVPLGPWIDGQYWTLRAEIGFYLTIFLLILLRWTHRFQGFACLLILASAPSLIGESLERMDVIAANPFHLMGQGIAQLLPIHFGSYFGLGMLFWLRHERLLRPSSWPFVVLALVSGTMAGIAHGLSTGARYADSFPAVQASWWMPMLVWLSSCLLIALCRPLHLPRDRPMRRTLSVVRTLGLATYPLYLIHLSLGVWIMHVMTARGLPPIAALAFIVITMVLVSIAVATRGEPPLRRGLRRISEAMLARNWVSSKALARPAPLTAGPPEAMMPPPETVR